MTRWTWKPNENRGVYAETRLGRYDVERTKRRTPRFVTRLNGNLIAIRENEEEAILAAKDDLQRANAKK